MNNFTHSVVMENREKLSITGINFVEEFDENIIILQTESGNLIIKGEGLHVEKLNLESSELEIIGNVYSLDYIDTYKKGTMWSKLFK